MKAAEAIRLRKSTRGYKPDPVPKEILTEILETASRAPSSMNSQPWEVKVMTGKVLDEVRRGNVELLTAGREFSSEFAPKPFEGVYRVICSSSGPLLLRSVLWFSMLKSTGW